MQLDALFKQPQALPAVPKIVHELIDSFNSDDISIDDIAKKIAADPVLSARLLRLANSAYYHVSRTVGTVDDAVMMLGFVTVRTLVISSGPQSQPKWYCALRACSRALSPFHSARLPCTASTSRARASAGSKHSSSSLRPGFRRERTSTRCGTNMLSDCSSRSPLSQTVQ